MSGSIPYWLSVYTNRIQGEEDGEVQRVTQYTVGTNFVFKVWVTLSLSVKELSNFKVAILWCQYQWGGTLLRDTQ